MALSIDLNRMKPVVRAPRWPLAYGPPFLCNWILWDFVTFPFTKLFDPTTQTWRKWAVGIFLLSTDFLHTDTAPL
jgi:hypothetical protein